MSETDHQGMAESYQRGFGLDYLERIANALEKLVEQQETRPVIQMFQSLTADPKQELSAEDIYRKTKAAFELANQLCLDDDPRIREKSTPCVRRKGHATNMEAPGGHKDAYGGMW